MQSIEMPCQRESLLRSSVGIVRISITPSAMGRSMISEELMPPTVPEMGRLKGVQIFELKEAKKKNFEKY